MKTLAFVIMLSALACSPSFVAPGDALIECTTDRDCPEPLRCQLAANHCVAAADLDVTPPKLIAAATTSPTLIILTFDEALDTTIAVDAANYIAQPPLAFDTAAVGADGETVALAVEREDDGVSYELTVRADTDVAGNLIAAPNDRVTFTGVGPAIDHAAPVPVAPTNGARIAGVAPTTLQWSAVSGAQRYIVDVAMSSAVDAAQPPALSLPIPGSPFTVLPTRPGGTPPSQLDVPLPSGGSFYWQARADITTEALHVARFDAVDDTLYVFCSKTAACDASVGAGTVNFPYQSIGRALAAASIQRVANVAIADRGSGVAYEELVTLADGVGLHGGYAADFSQSSRDSGLNTTAIHAAGVTTLFGANLTQPLLVDHLTVHGGTAATVHTVELANVTQVVFDHVRIDGGSAVTESTALAIQSSASGVVTVSQSNVQAGSANTNSYGIAGVIGSLSVSASTVSADDLSMFGPTSRSAGIQLIQAGALTVTDALVHGGAGDVSIGIVADNGSAAMRIERSIVTSGTATDSSYAISANVPSVTLIDSVVDAGYGTNNSVGYIGDGTTTSEIIVNNTIGAGPAGASQTVAALRTRSSIIANNILFARGSSQNLICIWLIDANPLSVENNLYFGCTPVQNGSEPSPVIDINQCSTYPGSWTQPTTCAANFTDASATSFFANYAGGDYHLTTAASVTTRFGGRDTASSSYGGVTVDHDNVARTCPTPLTACYSVGAYELD